MTVCSVNVMFLFDMFVFYIVMSETNYNFPA